MSQLSNPVANNWKEEKEINTSHLGARIGNINPIVVSFSSLKSTFSS